MRDTRLKQKKRRDLYALYRKGLEEGRFSSMRDAASYISRQPAPCFYVSPDQASLLVGHVLAGKTLDSFSPSQRRLALQLCNDYKNYLSGHPGTRRSRIDIMDELVDNPAPEWYMTPDAIRKMLREEVREVRSKLGWGD